MTTPTTEPNQIERPTDTLAPGQRRRSTCTNGVLLSPGKEFMVIERRTDGRWKYVYDGDSHPFYRDAAGILTYSEPVAPTPAGPSGEGRPRPAKGQKWRFHAKHVGIVTLEDHPRVAGEFQIRRQDGTCGGVNFTEDDIVKSAEYVDSPPSPQIEAEGSGPVEAAKARWRAERGLDEKLAPKATPVAAKRREVPASCLMERWNETGPLSAIEAIQAKKPPEPWRPSCDEYDLLPDAGTSWSDTRGSGRP